MDKQEAFKIVFDELWQLPQCRGKYSGREEYHSYMLGISAVVGLIACHAGEEAYEKFDYVFYDNMIQSEKGGDGDI